MYAVKTPSIKTLTSFARTGILLVYRDQKSLVHRKADTDLDHVADAYQARDERRAVKSLIRAGAI